MAVAIGGAEMRWGVFVLAVVAMVILHSAANILNDAYDFKKGLDREVFPASGAVVRGLLSPKEAVRLAAALFAIGTLLGLVIAWMTTWLILLLGIVGIAIGIVYSATPAGLKYRALGDAAVFLDFGILGSLGGWMVQTGEFSWLPVVWAVPLSLLVVGILHANNWRDIQGDRAGECRTVASLLGDEGSRRYYAFLIFAPFVLVLCFIFLPRLIGWGVPMSHWFLLVFFSLPLGIRLVNSSRAGADGLRDLNALDGATAKLDLIFGVLCTLALLLQVFVAS